VCWIVTAVVAPAVIDSNVNDMSEGTIVVPGGRCYECFRPKAACFCDVIPRIDNQTEVLILQHRRERFHPFNTARIVHKALRNSRLLVDYTSNLASQLQLKPRAGLLYPGPTTRLITDLTPEERPEQLVVLDGTWHQAKTLLRDIPALQSLPRYRLDPAQPSRYRIRREPSDAALSTVEAAVAALSILEPETAGFDLLLRAFDTMVEGQLAHPGAENGQRFREGGSRTFKNVPLPLLTDIENIVVAYGEAPRGERGRKRTVGPPVSWVAQRLGSGESFSCVLTPPRPLDDVFLRYLELTKADFESAISLDEARSRWAEFERPGDVVAVFHPGTARLFSYLAGNCNACLVLKSVDLELRLGEPTIEDGLPTPQDSDLTGRSHGRAGHRLASTIRYLRHLHAVANARPRSFAQLTGLLH